MESSSVPLEAEQQKVTFEVPGLAAKILDGLIFDSGFVTYLLDQTRPEEDPKAGLNTTLVASHIILKLPDKNDRVKFDWLGSDSELARSAIKGCMTCVF